jgi:hypothetical protein
MHVRQYVIMIDSLQRNGIVQRNNSFIGRVHAWGFRLAWMPPHHSEQYCMVYQPVYTLFDIQMLAHIGQKHGELIQIYSTVQRGLYGETNGNGNSI